jgi:hypothetical protein
MKTMKSNRTIFLLVVLATLGLFVFLHPMQAFADTHTWDGGYGNNYWYSSYGNNWSPNGNPVAGDDVYISASPSQT